MRSPPASRDYRVLSKEHRSKATGPFAIIPRAPSPARLRAIAHLYFGRPIKQVAQPSRRFKRANGRRYLPLPGCFPSSRSSRRSNGRKSYSLRSSPLQVIRGAGRWRHRTVAKDGRFPLVLDSFWKLCVLWRVRLSLCHVQVRGRSKTEERRESHVPAASCNG